MINDMTYLSEIVEDYKESSTPEEKEFIFQNFCEQIWRCRNKRRVYPKTIHYRVDKKIKDTDVGPMFETYARIEYLSYKAFSSQKDWCSLIRQKVNNLYSIHFDKSIIHDKEYLNLLLTPRRLYYEYLHGSNDSAVHLMNQIQASLAAAETLKETLSGRKLSLTWNDYKIVVETYFRKCFENCLAPSDSNPFGMMDEDNYYIKYFCKSLCGYVRNYKYEVSGLYVPNHNNTNYHTKSCTSCGKLYLVKSPNQRRCPACRQQVRYYSPACSKTKTCIDCNTTFEVSSKNNQSCRCPACKKIYQKERDRLRKQLYRSHAKCSSVPSAISI